MQRRRYAAALIALGLLAAVAGWSQEQEQGSDGPKLVIDGPRVQTLLPGLAAKGMGKRFNFTARLEGELEDPEKFYCLDQIWEWGDGTESLREIDCDPYEEGAEVPRQFSGSHGYGYGRYEVTLRLVRRDETVIRGSMQIAVY